MFRILFGPHPAINLQLIPRWWYNEWNSIHVAWKPGQDDVSDYEVQFNLIGECRPVSSDGHRKHYSTSTNANPQTFFTTSTNANPQSLHTTFSCANANHRGGRGTVNRGARWITWNCGSEYLFLNQPVEMYSLPQFVCLRRPYMTLFKNFVWYYTEELAQHLAK